MNIDKKTSKKDKIIKAKNWALSKVGSKGRDKTILKGIKREVVKGDGQSYAKYLDIIYVVSKYLPLKDLLTCRTVCWDAVCLANTIYNGGMTIFQERCRVSLLTAESLKLVEESRCTKFFPQELSLQPITLSLTSLECLEVFDRYLQSGVGFIVGKMIYDTYLFDVLQVIDLTAIDNFDISYQSILETMFSFNGDDSFARLERLDMCSIPALTLPAMSILGDSEMYIMGELKIGGMSTLKVLNCNNLGDNELKMKNGSYVICDLPKLETLLFNKIEMGPTIILKNLPNLECIEIKELNISDFSVPLKELPSLKRLIINGNEVEIDRSQDIMLLSGN